MWVLWFWALLVAAIIGAVAKFGFDYEKIPYTNRQGSIQISWPEFAVVMVIIAVVVVPLTTKVGLKMAKASKLTYHEFWGGYETAANHSAQTCERDGSCDDTYNCDVWYTTELDYDSKGNVVGSHEVAHYHHCPVATEENYWSISTTLGDFDLGMTFSKNAVPWRAGHGLDDTPQGPPWLWAAAKKRLDAGDPGPVTADKTYDNYILASTNTILHRFSDAVTKYKAAHLLPEPVTNLKRPIYDYYYADKMSFVKLPILDPARTDWEFALARLNAGLGTDLQGDLHVVAINASKVKNPDEYAGAVNAFWQDKSLGRRALSKNGIGLVLGVDILSNKITWARAFTGMPVGNDGLTLDLQNNVTGAAFSPEIFGHPVGKLNAGKMTVTHDNSLVQSALWGTHQFKRVCMVCKTKGDSGVGYGYLGGEIQPSSGQKHLIILVSVFFSIIIWAIALFTMVGEKTTGRKKETAW